MLEISILLLICINGGHQLKYELPEFVKPCKNNTDLSKCTAQTLEDLRPRLAKGISEFDIPPIDPLHVPYIAIDQRNLRIANFIANATNISWTGIKNFEIIDTFLNSQELIFRLKLAFPVLIMDVEGYVRGSLLAFEVDGTGGALVNFTNVTLDIILNGELYKSKEKEFIKWATEDMGIAYDDVYYVDLYGFFEDSTVTHLWKLALNRGARLISSIFRTVLRSISDFILLAINRVHRLFPKNVLYLS